MNTFALLLPDLALIFLGYVICRFTPLNRTVWEQIDRLVYFFLFPVLLFHSIVKKPIDLVASAPFVFAAMSLLSLSIALTYAVRFWPRMDKRQHAAAAQVGFRFNSFIALAVAERIGGNAGLQWMAVLMGVSVPMCNAAAVWIMAQGSQQHLLRLLLKNPLLIATTAGLLVNVFGLTIPVPIEPHLQRLGQASLVLGLLAAGAGMQIRQLRQTPLLSAAVLSMRHVINPIIAACLVFIWQACGLILTPLQVLMLLAFAAMPTAPSSYVLAARMGYNGAYVSGLVTVSTVLAVFSLWFALGVIAPRLA